MERSPEQDLYYLPAKLLEFWEWWLLDAVPAAWQAALEDPPAHPDPVEVPPWMSRMAAEDEYKANTEPHDSPWA